MDARVVLKLKQVDVCTFLFDNPGKVAVKQANNISSLSEESGFVILVNYDVCHIFQ